MIFKPILSSYKKSDGQKNIRIYIYDPDQKEFTRIKTEFYCYDYEFKNGKVKSGPNADIINSRVNMMIAGFENEWLKNPNLKVTDFKTGTEKNLLEFADEFYKGIKSGKILIKGKRSVNKGKPYSPNTVKTYKTYTQYLKDFNPKLNWNDITEDFLNDYVVFLREGDYSENTIAKAIKVLCSLMRQGKKYHNNTEFESFEASYQDADVIFLNDNEMEKWVSCELPEHLEQERRRFYISYNFFLRFGDSLEIKKTDIFKADGKPYARFMSEKTKQITVIPLFPKTVEYLKDINYHMPKTTNFESNWKLKEIGKIAEIDSIYTKITVKNGEVHKLPACKYTFITTHTARRSMATNYYLSMKKHGTVDLVKIMKMGGWKSIDQLLRYIRIGQLSNALDASKDPFFN